MYYVYILKCTNQKLYIGCTANLKERVRRHKNGEVLATKRILPVRLIFYTCFLDKYIAFAFEKYLKTGSGRAFVQKHFMEK